MSRSNEAAEGPEEAEEEAPVSAMAPPAEGRVEASAPGCTGAEGWEQLLLSSSTCAPSGVDVSNEHHYMSHLRNNILLTSAASSWHSARLSSSCQLRALSSYRG